MTILPYRGSEKDIGAAVKPFFVAVMIQIHHHKGAT
jgi:hypothetical protein